MGSPSAGRSSTGPSGERSPCVSLGFQQVHGEPPPTGAGVLESPAHPSACGGRGGCGGCVVSAGGDTHSTSGEPGAGGGWAPLGCPLKLPVSLCGHLPGRGSQASADTLTGGWMSAWEGLLPSFNPRGGGGSGCISPQGRTGCQLEDRGWALTGACWRFPSTQFLLLPPPCPTRPVACL